MFSARGYRRITAATVVALCAITLTGAGVRLTGSGLGCSDWPMCEQGQFVAALDEPHAIIEFVNRLVTGIVSLAIILAVAGAVVRKPRRVDLIRWSLGLVVGMIGQIVLGGMVVLLELTPLSVIGHFLLSMVLIANALVLHDRAGTAAGPAVDVGSPPLRRFGGALATWGLLVLVTGTVVTGSGPHGGDTRAERLGFAIPDVARIHGIAVLLFLALTVAMVRAAGRRGSTARLGWWLRALAVSIVVQGAIGYTQYLVGVPAWLVQLHIAGALAVWISVVQVRLATVVRPLETPEAPEPDPDASTHDGEPWPALR